MFSSWKPLYRSSTACSPVFLSLFNQICVTLFVFGKPRVGLWHVFIIPCIWLICTLTRISLISMFIYTRPATKIYVSKKSRWNFVYVLYMTEKDQVVPDAINGIPQVRLSCKFWRHLLTIALRVGGFRLLPFILFLDRHWGSRLLFLFLVAQIHMIKVERSPKNVLDKNISSLA